MKVTRYIVVEADEAGRPVLPPERAMVRGSLSDRMSHATIADAERELAERLDLALMNRVGCADIEGFPGEVGALAVIEIDVESRARHVKSSKKVMETRTEAMPETFGLDFVGE